MKKPAPVKHKPAPEPAPTTTLLSQDELAHRLAFSQDNVMYASTEQPVLFYQAAEHRVAVFQKYLTAKSELATIRAAVLLNIRQLASAIGEKLTEATVEAKVVLDENVNMAQAAFQDAEVNEERARLLVESYRMRRDSLKVMMEWRGADLRAQQAQEFVAETAAGLQVRYPKG